MTEQASACVDTFTSMFTVTYRRIVCHQHACQCASPLIRLCVHSSPPRYLAASDMTASGVLRPKDLEMVLLSAERESERKTARERVRQLEEGDKGCGGVNKKTEEKMKKRR